MFRSGFFNSINNDRVYDAGFLAEYFASFIGNGVFPNPSNNLQILANDNTTMTVTLIPGFAWIKGYLGINDNDMAINIAPADGVLNRIDRVVLRYDVAGREIIPVLKKGAFASSPVAPTLQRDPDAYELALADIYVGKGVVGINQANITDTRLNTELCGVVHGVVDQVDTTTLFNQYAVAFSEDRVQFQNDFNAWFSTLESILDANIAANLLNMINDLQTQVSQHSADDNVIKHRAKQIALEDVSNKFTATNVEGAMTELFTNVSNGKQAVGTAITDVDNSVVIPTNPTHADLASAIGGISTGKKWASGVVTSSTAYVEVGNLGFKPSVVIVKVVTSDNYLYGAGAFVDMSIYISAGVMGFTENLNVYMTDSGQILPNESSVGIDSFKMRATRNVAHNWIAFE